MRRLFARILAVALVILSAGLSHAWANDRVALVIGNSKYARVSPLPNPTNDAADMKVALEKLGFEVIAGFDLTKPEMVRKIAEFSVKLWGSKIGLFFYAGHGIQLDNANYLVPIDAEANSLAALEFSLIRAQSIQELMQRYTETSILFLDSCRDFPPARALSRDNSGSGRGLARVDAKVDTLISFSTEPGSIAKDGTGRNSPFTEALTALIGTPQKDLSSILIDVRNRVLQATNYEQITWEHSALRRHVYLADSASISTAAIPERQEAAPAGNAQIAMLTPPASESMGIVRSVNTGAQTLT